VCPARTKLPSVGGPAEIGQPRLRQSAGAISINCQHISDRVISRKETSARAGQARR
jgi:hypothetical protein